MATHPSRPDRASYRSPAARRAVRRESEVVVATSEAVAKGVEGAADRLLSTVFGSQTYEKLPRFRKAYVEGYADGRLDAARIAAGLEPRVSQLQPSQRPEPTQAPRWVRNLQPGARWHQHPNGEGWVSETAYVELGAYVGPFCAVFDRARVLDTARIFGEGTRVFGDAEIWGHAHVRAASKIHGTAQVCDNARVIGTEVYSGRIDGRTVIKSEADLRITTARPYARRASGVQKIDLAG